MPNHKRLPRNFHKTFVPERQYVQAMLKFSSTEQEGNYQQIAAVTGIPMGKSSGKTSAILDYCRGMGLIILKNSMGKATKIPRLTPFGQTVLSEDPYLRESITQWFAHLNLCNPYYGADVWYQIFVVGAKSLGNTFYRSTLNEYLQAVYGVQTKNLIGPLVRMYEDAAAFSACGVLQESDSLINKISAPVKNEYGWGYCAWLIDNLKTVCTKDAQITITELDQKVGWKTIPGWNNGEAQQILEMIERRGIIEVDRHMNPWIIRPKLNVNNLWKHLYDELI